MKETKAMTNNNETKNPTEDSRPETIESGTHGFLGSLGGFLGALAFLGFLGRAISPYWWRSW
jgi:hypothetical protein